ncbi:PHD finger protein [Hirschfeldia incana]|nr:PHD finger protein [Hirschfeldia incana]
MDVDVTASDVPVNGNGGEPMSPPPPAKKRRFNEEMNRVAEIVLVLSALGRMRGGRAPTEMELELMVEARSKLAEMCQEFTPKDIIGSSDVRGVIEDLGLNVKDGRLGFSAPKISISEKLSLGKRKMEEAKQFLTPVVSHLSRPINGGVASPGPGKSVSVANKWISGEGTTVNPAGSHLSRPKMVLNGAASQGTGVPANSSANYYAGSWSTQPQSTISFASAPSKKVPIQSPVRARDPSIRPFMSQTPHGAFPGTTNQPMQGVHYGPTSSFQNNNHSEIAKMIYNVLHPRVKQYPVWNPPSRDYISRAMTCQMCEVTIYEVETLLICDACEKAYHLKCLQAKGVPKSEWHCSKCVRAANGKPFPPKYGRAVTTSTAKKVGSVDTKVNLQKPIVTTGPRVQNVPGFVSGAATTSRSETSRVNANTIASAAKTTYTGTQSFRDSLIRCTNSPALVSLTKTPDPTAIANKSVGTMSSSSSLRVGNLAPVNAISNATLSTPVTSSLVAEAPPVTENGYKSSSASDTADHSMLNTELTTQAQVVTVTSSGNSQPEVSQSETAKATEDAAMGQALNADDGLQASLENVSRCENTSESLNNKTTPENGQESSKDATEKFAFETCQNHSTETSTAVESDHDSKMTAEPSMPKDNYQTEEIASQPPSVSSNYHSQTEKETPNAQDTLQNVSEDSQEGKGLLSDLDDKNS